MSDLGPAVETVVRRCLRVEAGEEVVVVVDLATRMIGEALRDEARAVGGEAVLTVMDERATDGTEPPASIAADKQASNETPRTNVLGNEREVDISMGPQCEPPEV